MKIWNLLTSGWHVTLSKGYALTLAIVWESLIVKKVLFLIWNFHYQSIIILGIEYLDRRWRVDWDIVLDILFLQRTCSEKFSVNFLNFLWDTISLVRDSQANIDSWEGHDNCGDLYFVWLFDIEIRVLRRLFKNKLFLKIIYLAHLQLLVQVTGKRLQSKELVVNYEQRRLLAEVLRGQYLESC